MAKDPYRGHKGEPERVGTSLPTIAGLPDDRSRMVLSEYHGTVAITGMYMRRRGWYKYIHYHQYEPELYDMENDPEELDDLSGKPEYKCLVREFGAHLNIALDPYETIAGRGMRKWFSLDTMAEQM